MKISVDLVKLEGSWWGSSVPTMVLEEVPRPGRARQRVRIQLTPGVADEIARVLWKAQRDHALVTANMARALKGE